MRSLFSLAALSAINLFGASCAEAPAAGEASPARQVLQTRTGLASFYGAAFHGEETASGEVFDKRDLVAAHPSYPFDTIVRVTNLENGRSLELRIIDRGPTEKYQSEGVIIDVSRGAAQELGFVQDGRTRVRVEVLEWGTRE